MPHAAESALEAPPLLTADAALFLDFDGTLAPIVARPEQAAVLPALPPLLDRLHARLEGAVAVITGRRLQDVDRRLAPLLFAGAGLHGAELRTAPRGDVVLQWQPDTRTLVGALHERFGNDPRIVIEDKQLSVALHYRQAPERGEECRLAMNTLVPADAFELVAGSMVIEARPRGANKGQALRALRRHAPFRDRLPVFVGDDVTDEDGFAAAADSGGYGVKVGAGRTVARYRLRGIEDLVDWLVRSLSFRS